MAGQLATTRVGMVSAKFKFSVLKKLESACFLNLSCATSGVNYLKKKFCSNGNPKKDGMIRQRRNTLKGSYHLKNKYPKGLEALGYLKLTKHFILDTIHVRNLEILLKSNRNYVMPYFKI